MKLAAFIGIALIVVGILSFVHQESFYTNQQKVIDISALLAGVVLLVVNSNKSLVHRQ